MKSKPHPPRRAAPRQVRIIGGQWKRTPLPVLDAEGLRPTPDRVRETVFNWINHQIDGDWNTVRCLDLFAGTGALGFEAASRGAASVTMVENNTAALRQLDANKTRLGAQQITLLRGDALAALRSMAARGAMFDLIFIDPPYHQEWLVKILPACLAILSEAGMVYAEAEMPLDTQDEPPWLQPWEVVRADQAGMVYYHLLRRNSPTEIQA